MNFPFPDRARIIRDRIGELLAHRYQYDEQEHAQLIFDQAQALVEACMNADFEREWQYHLYLKSKQNSP